MTARPACTDFRSWLLAARDVASSSAPPAVDAAQSDLAREHVAACAECAALASKEALLRLGLRAAQEWRQAQSAEPGDLQAFQTRLRRRLAATAARHPPAPSRLVLAGVAAALLLVTFIALRSSDPAGGVQQAQGPAGLTASAAGGAEHEGPAGPVSASVTGPQESLASPEGLHLVWSDGRVDVLSRETPVLLASATPPEWSF